MNLKKKLRDAKNGSEVHPNRCRDPIAIIGIGCRYPGISNPEEFWQTLIAGKEVVGPYPGGRFAELDHLYEEARRKPGRLLTDRGGFLADLAGFDAEFFEISPREALYFDPQHRLLLEVALEAMEDAGQVRETCEGSATGVYTGLWTSEYEARLYESGAERDFYSVTGCGRAAAPAWLSFAFGLQGPSLTVDTACSSSLAAVHLACQALWAGEIDMALAGGANVILGCEISELFTQAKILSPDGRCKFGDASADGFVRGEGAGIVVLKRLSQAVADKDPIYALIRGSAMNNDARTSDPMVPSLEGQQQMLRTAWKSAGIDAKDILYIEMHGTGTSIGDRVEIRAVSGALAKSGVTRPCWLGSVKTNMGHTEAAAGVAGLIKAALTAKHRSIAPSLHCTVPNPKIAWQKVPVRIAKESVDLSAEPGPILVGVSSFGLSGTNAHVVLEEAAPSPAKTSQGAGPYILPISAKTPEARYAMLGAHLAAMRSAGREYPVQDVCYTASARRNHYEYRAAIVGDDLKEMEKNLAAAVAREDCDGVVFGRENPKRGKVVFVASGQGSQWLGMARELFDRDPVFRQAFEQCDSAIAAVTDWHLIDHVLGPDAERYLSQIDVIQPALFAMSVSLAAVWRGWGIEPDAVVGHSMGEVAAAHIAGILSLKDAATVICHRSRLMRTLKGTGGMATVELPLHDVETLLKSRDNVSVAASNGPNTTVISGDSKAVETLLKELEAKEIYCRRIKVDVASHSAQVDPILNDLLKELSGIGPQPAQIPMLSTVTGEYAAASGSAGTVMDAGYWVENLRRSVLFAPAIEKLSRDAHGIFIELSPHPILLPSIEASAREANPRAFAVASLRREKPARATMLYGLASLHVVGCKIAWERLYPEDVRCVRLPQYAFQRKRYWPEPGDPARVRIARHTSDIGPLLGRRFESSLQPNAFLWETELDIATLPSLNDHRVLRSVVLPASGHVEMALSAAKSVRPGQGFELLNVSFLSAAYLPEKSSKIFQLALIPDGDQAFRFELRGRADRVENPNEDRGETVWTLHSTGTLAAVGIDSETPPALPLAEVKGRCQVHRNREELYEKTTGNGLHDGPAFQPVEEAWVGVGESLCRFRFDAKDGDGYAVHPALLDACLYAIAYLKTEQGGFNSEDTYLPIRIERFRVHGGLSGEGDVFAQATLANADPVKGTLRANLRISDAEDNIRAEIIGMELMRVAGESLPDAVEPLYVLEWIEEKHREKAQEKAEAAVALVPRIAAENWVIFADNTGADHTGADNTGIAEAMKGLLVSAGGRCTLVRTGSGFRKIAESEFEINPSERKDLDRLFEEVTNGIGVPTAVVHLWSLDNNSTKTYKAERLIRSQAIGSQQVPGIVQAITAANWQTPPRLWLVTAGVMTPGDGTGSDRNDKDLPRIENAPMWGIGSTVAREHAELRTTLVDLSAASDSKEARALALQICTGEKEDRIALRGDTKYVARLVHFSAASEMQVKQPTNDTQLFSANATYLITGGLGGVALTVAEWMARNGAGHLVLLSRRAPTAESAEAIRGMEEAGATVVAIRGDVTREADLAEILKTIHASGFPLKGIMHTAAVVDDALIRDLSPERLPPVMAPKITGTWNLHVATLKEDLDFFILFSSLAALLPQPGMGSYAAANAFLDTFAHYRRTLGKPAISVNWGAWDRIGLAQAADTEQSLGAYQREGMRAFSAREALDLLRRVIESDPVQVITLPIDLDRFAEFHGADDIPPMFADLVSRSQLKTVAQTDRSEALDQLGAAESEKERQEILEAYLQEVLGRVIKLAAHKIDRERPLGSMGLDSLMGLELVRRLSNALQIAVSATVVFNYPTIKLLAAYLLQRMHLEPAGESAVSIEKSANAPALHTKKDEAVGNLSGDLSEEDALQVLMGNERRSS